MDIQLKRGMLEICVLTVLLHSDSYGYQIIKDASSCIQISQSTLYPILKRLETSQMVSVYSIEHSGRLRKYYKITQKGIEKILEFKNEWKEIVKVYEFISSESEGLKDD